MMASSTVLRVKRKIEENPQDALVVTCKRVKTGFEEEVAPALFVFKGTVNDQNATSVELKNAIARNKNLLDRENISDSIITKIRSERKEASAENRYEVVNCSRGLKDTTDNNGDIFDLVDLEKPTDPKTDVQYEYDLYVPVKDEFDVSMLDNLVSIEHLNDNLMFEINSDEEVGDSEDDDSNDENNWRNDYPDSYASSTEEDFMSRAMEQCALEDLSSDSSDCRQYESKIDTFAEDSRNYGIAYAKYKAKVLSEQPHAAQSKYFVMTKGDDASDTSTGYKDGDSEDIFYYGQEEDTEQFREQYADSASDGPD